MKVRYGSLDGLDWIFCYLDKSLGKAPYGRGWGTSHNGLYGEAPLEKGKGF